MSTSHCLDFAENSASSPLAFRVARAILPCHQRELIGNVYPGHPSVPSDELGASRNESSSFLFLVIGSDIRENNSDARFGAKYLWQISPLGGWKHRTPCWAMYSLDSSRVSTYFVVNSLEGEGANKKENVHLVIFL